MEHGLCAAVTQPLERRGGRLEDGVVPVTAATLRRRSSNPPLQSDFGGCPEPEIVDIPLPVSTSTELFDAMLYA